MKVKKAAIVVELDDNKGTRQIYLSANEENMLISFIYQLKSPVKVSDFTLDGLIFIENEENK